MQNIFTKHLSLVNHFNKLVLTNRTINVLTLPICAGIKQEAKDLLSKLNIPEKPKRPLSAYMQYLFEKRPQVKVNYPNLSNIELIKKMSEDWKNLSSDLKLNYENKAKQNKEEYDKRLLQFNNNLTPEQKTVLNQIQSELREEAKKRKLKREIKQHNKPKKPASAYSLFLLSYAKEQGLNIAHAMQSGKGKWDALSEQEKEKYYKEYSEKKKMFEEELAVWEAKMIAEGREKLIRGKTLKAFDKFNEKSPVVKKICIGIECLYLETIPTSLGEDTVTLKLGTDALNKKDDTPNKDRQLDAFNNYNNQEYFVKEKTEHKLTQQDIIKTEEMKEVDSKLLSSSRIIEVDEGREKQDKGHKTEGILYKFRNIFKF